MHIIVDYGDGYGNADAFATGWGMPEPDTYYGIDYSGSVYDDDHQDGAVFGDGTLTGYLYGPWWPAVHPAARPILSVARWENEDDRIRMLSVLGMDPLSEMPP